MQTPAEKRMELYAACMRYITAYDEWLENDDTEEEINKVIKRVARVANIAAAKRVGIRS